MKRVYKPQSIMQYKQNRYLPAFLALLQTEIERSAGAGWDLFMKTPLKTNLTNLSLHVTYRN
jgi:hypothetical protein